MTEESAVPTHEAGGTGAGEPVTAPSADGVDAAAAGAAAKPPDGGGSDAPDGELETVEIIAGEVEDDGTVVIDDLVMEVDAAGNVVASDERVEIDLPDGTVIVDETFSVAGEDGELEAIEEDVTVFSPQDPDGGPSGAGDATPA